MFQTPGSQDPQLGGSGSEPTKSKAHTAPPAVDATLRAGAKLTQARELLGLSLDQVAERTRVRRDYLEALEAMNVKLLPGRAYALAYLRSYANALSLEPDAIIRQFQQESALTREDAQPQLRNPDSKPQRERPWLLAATLAVLVVGFAAWRLLLDDHVDPRLHTAAADAPVAASPLQTQAAPAQIVPPAMAPPSDLAPRAVVEVRVNMPSWLEVRGPDGTIFMSRDLNAGDRYLPDVGAGWTLHARDGAAFEIFVDGRDVGTLGEAGQPVLGRRVDALAQAEAAPMPAAAYIGAPTG